MPYLGLPKLRQPRHRRDTDRRRRQTTAAARVPAQRLGTVQDEAILSLLRGKRFTNASPCQVQAQMFGESVETVLPGVDTWKFRAGCRETVGTLRSHVLE
jgi:hypothetical protein